jgi:hypothetical protein
MTAQERSPVVLDQLPVVQVFKSAAYSMKPTDHVVVVNTASAGVTVTAPPATECAGQLHAIYKTGGGTNLVTVIDNGSGAHALTLTGGGPVVTGEDDNDSVVIFSDGRAWTVLGSFIAD